MKINEILERYKNWHIVVIGCGGTGSNLVPHLAQLLYPLRGITTVTLVDEDIVEPGNIGRQFFSPHDVGNNKARTLQSRYQNAWGVRISYHPHYIREESILEKLLIPPASPTGPAMPILVGAVDNHFSRRIMDAVFKRADNLIYLDAGNGEHTGQVVAAMRYKGETLLKPPSEYFPEISNVQDEISVGGTCGSKVVKEPQTLVANIWAATTLLTLISNIVNLKRIQINLASFSTLNCVSKPVFRTEAV